MPFKNLTLVTSKLYMPKNPVFTLLMEALIVSTFGFLIAKYLLSDLWNNYMNLCHTSIELACVFIALATFVTVWYTYERTLPINQLIGFGFFLIAIFLVFHTYYSFNLQINSNRYLGLSISYLMLSKITQAIVLSVASFKLFHLKSNKWLGFLSTILIAVATSYIVTIYPHLFTSPLNKPGQLSLIPILSYIIIAVFLLCLYKIEDKVDSRDIISYRYIFLALLMAIPSELCFIFYKTLGSFYNILSHFFKMISYYYLFKGIFVGSITYPYEKLEQTSEYITNIINYLPIGLIAYSNDLKVKFNNQKAIDVIGCQERKIQDLLAEQIFQNNISLRDKLITIRNCSGKENKLKVNGYQLKNQEFLALFNEAKKEQELENLQLQTQTILNSINSLVLIFDDQKKVITCNKAAENIMRIETSTLTGMKLRYLKKVLQFNGKRTTKKESTREALNNSSEASIVTLDGSRKDLLIQSAPILNVDGEKIGGVIIASDITTLKEEQERLQQRDKLASLGQMATGIVHEIRNPLTTIKGFCQLIVPNIQNEKVIKYVQTIEEEVEELNKVVTDFLTFAKPRLPSLEEIPLNQLISSMRLILESHCFIKGIELEFIFGLADEEIVMVDQHQIKQVVLNIVKNGIEAVSTIASPRLAISTALSKSMNEGMIIISDNGKGIPEKEKSMIGTPFFTTKDKGTGLGLSICYQIIREHGGRITLESQEREGTTFIIALPLSIK